MLLLLQFYFFDGITKESENAKKKFLQKKNAVDRTQTARESETSLFCIHI